MLTFLSDEIARVVALDQPFPDSVRELCLFAFQMEPHRHFATLSQLDFDADGARLREWLTPILRKDPPDKRMKAFYFSIADSYRDGDDKPSITTLYVSGSETFDKDDDEWACDCDYDPDDPGGDSTVLRHLSELNAGRHSSELIYYFLILGYSALAVRELARTIPPELLLGSRKARHFAPGFSDGDLVVVGALDAGKGWRTTPADKGFAAEVAAWRKREPATGWPSPDAMERLDAVHETGEVAALIGALGDPDTAVRTAAAHRLGASAEPAARGALVDLIADRAQPDMVSRAAANGLVSWSKSLAGTDADRVLDSINRILATKGTCPWLTHAVIKLAQAMGHQAGSTVPALLAMREKPVHEKAATEAIAAIGTDSPTYIAALVKQLGHKDMFRRWDALQALGELGPKAAHVVPQVREAFAREKDDFIQRRYISECLSELGAAGAEFVLELVGHKSPDIRDCAALFFRIPPGMEEKAARVLAGALSDKSEEVRRSAARSLGGLGLHAVAAGGDRLVELIRDKKSSQQTKGYVAQSLAQLGIADRARTEILALANARSDDNKLYVIWAMRDAGWTDSEAVETLTRLAGSKEGLVCGPAIGALHRLGVPDAEERVTRAVRINPVAAREVADDLRWHAQSTSGVKRAAEANAHADASVGAVGAPSEPPADRDGQLAEWCLGILERVGVEASPGAAHVLEAWADAGTDSHRDRLGKLLRVLRPGAADVKEELDQFAKDGTGEAKALAAELATLWFPTKPRGSRGGGV